MRRARPFLAARLPAALLAAALCATLGATHGTARADSWIDDDVAVLQVLDKVVSRISTIDAPIGKPVAFGTLEITVRACRKHPPEEPPESAAFIEIREKKADEAAKLEFSGWMFASSPALSTLQDPVYDVWVVDCKNSKS